MQLGKRSADSIQVYMIYTGASTDKHKVEFDWFSCIILSQHANDCRIKLPTPSPAAPASTSFTC